MTDTSLDRRRTRRLDEPAEHGIRSVRIRPGHSARLVDVSAAGALLETTHRLLPGAAVELQMETEGDRTRVRGQVVRCSVVRVRAAGVCYRGAIAFDRHLPWFVAERGYVVPGVEQRASHTSGADATRTVV